MINQLLSNFGIHRSALVLGVASNVVRAFEAEFVQDHDAKIASIKALINILESYQKSTHENPMP
jgi:hypothetical protein